MPVVIVGADKGSEYEAAKTLKKLLDPLIGGNYQLTIVVGARCLGESVQDIDLLLLGSFGRGINFIGSHGDARGKEIRLVNICMIIEVKDVSSPYVIFDSQHVKVKYANDIFWHDASEQVFKQKISLRNFLKRNNQPQPRIEGIIWLRNYDGDIPAVASDVLCANPSLDDFTKVLEKVKPPSGKDQDFYIAFTNNENINAIQNVISFFTPKITPTNLDRRRLEIICKKLISDQKYVERLGKQLLIFRGRGGSGKTIHLLRLAKDLYDEGSRVLLLTFNKALVADIKRLLVIMKINNQGFDRGIYISTAHKFFIHMLSAWGMWSYSQEDSNNFPSIKYNDKKMNCYH